MTIETIEHLKQVLEKLPVGRSLEAFCAGGMELVHFTRTRPDAWRVNAHERPAFDMDVDGFVRVGEYLPVRLASYERRYWVEYAPTEPPDKEMEKVFLLQGEDNDTSLLLGNVGDPAWVQIWALASQYESLSLPRHFDGHLNGIQLSSPLQTQLVPRLEEPNGSLIRYPFHNDIFVTLLVVSSNELWGLVNGVAYGPLTKEQYYV